MNIVPRAGVSGNGRRLLRSSDGDQSILSAGRTCGPLSRDELLLLRHWLNIVADNSACSARTARRLLATIDAIRASILPRGMR
jgi:hypothetical protein